jgi:hypothetical protein
MGIIVFVGFFVVLFAANPWLVAWVVCDLLGIRNRGFRLMLAFLIAAGVAEGLYQHYPSQTEPVAVVRPPEVADFRAQRSEISDSPAAAVLNERR